MAFVHEKFSFMTILTKLIKIPKVRYKINTVRSLPVSGKTDGVV